MKRVMRQTATRNTTTQAVSYSYGNNAGALAAAPAAPVPASFAPATINFAETRADGGFGWDVKYDPSFDGTASRCRTAST